MSASFVNVFFTDFAFDCALDFIQKLRMRKVGVAVAGSVAVAAAAVACLRIVGSKQNRELTIRGYDVKGFAFWVFSFGLTAFCVSAKVKMSSTRKP